MQRLDLSDNPMTGDVAESLAEMLRGQLHLRALNLNDTSLEDAGVSTIAQALANSGTPLPVSTDHPATTLFAAKHFWVCGCTSTIPGQATSASCMPALQHIAKALGLTAGEKVPCDLCTVALICMLYHSTSVHHMTSFPHSTKSLLQCCACPASMLCL